MKFTLLDLQAKAPAQESASDEGSCQRSSRPPAPALTRTVQLLADDPNISAAELAATLNVSLSYAKTLMRGAAAQPSRSLPTLLDRALSNSTTPPAQAGADVQGQIATLSARLDEAERVLTAVRTTPPEIRGSWHQNRRAEILRLHAAGESPAAIAARLSIPSGDVAFVLKVESLISELA